MDMYWFENSDVGKKNKKNKSGVRKNYFWLFFGQPQAAGHLKNQITIT